MFRAMTIRGADIDLGCVVELEDEDETAELPLLGLVQALWHEGKASEAQVQVRVMVRGVETVLGDAASAHELFLTDVNYECPAASVLGRCKAHHLQVCLPSGVTCYIRRRKMCGFV